MLTRKLKLPNKLFLPRLQTILIIPNKSIKKTWIQKLREKNKRKEKIRKLREKKQAKKQAEDEEKKKAE